VDKEKDCSRFLEELLEARCGPKYNGMSIVEAVRLRANEKTLRAQLSRVEDVEGMAKRFNLTIAFTENLCKWLKEGK
jgi:hypothetical protein